MRVLYDTPYEERAPRRSVCAAGLAETTPPYCTVRPFPEPPEIHCVEDQPSTFTCASRSFERGRTPLFLTSVMPSSSICAASASPSSRTSSASVVVLER